MVIFWGLRDLLHHHIDTRPPETARFFVAGAVINDGFFIPVVLLLGIALARVVPGRWRAYVQAGLIIAGCLALFTYPEVRDYAHILHNPTSLPYNYTEHLLAVILVVWIGIAALAVVRTRPSRAKRRGGR